jgi:hypothetical protein
MVAAAWTGTLPGGAEIGKGLSLYRNLRRPAPFDQARPDRQHAVSQPPEWDDLCAATHEYLSMNRNS